MTSSTAKLGSAELQAKLLPHAGRLLDYLSRHIPANLRRVIDPQDVMQDAFFDACRAAEHFTSRDSESDWRWIVTIARHRLIKLIEANHTAKRGGQVPHVYDEERQGSVVLLLKDLAVYRRTPSTSAARRELLATLERCLDRLQPEYRDVLHLRFIDGLSLKETAEKLSRTEDSTQKLTARGLNALRVQLRTASLYV